MNRYNPKQIEPKWQAKWKESQIFHVKDDPKKPKKYVIDMFPYPSGEAMHVGHVRNFTISDVLSQYQRQKGYNVLHTMGWDTFGLPAENYAIKTGTPPAQTTKANINNFRKQLQNLGMSYDWSREINTSDPEYYKWTQWVFTQLFENKLAYQAENPQWWCPECKTVLANEQVVNGCCWRHEDTPVIKKNLKQWFFKITDYADQLLEGIDDLDWPEKIKTMQRNWIGKSVGADVDFTLKNSKEKITVFTTRPDTLFGATYMVLAPEHPLVLTLTSKENLSTVKNYQKQASSKRDLDRQMEGKEKTGVFTGAYAINSVNKEKIPIWIADYVMMNYGTGAIMAVPAHDQRDYDFAKKFKLPINVVIEPETGERQENPEFRLSIVAIVRNPKNSKLLSINWGKNLGGNLFVGGGLEKDEDIVECAMREILEETGYQNVKLVSKTENIHHHYFAHTKNVAREILATGLLFDLVDDNQVEQKLEKAEQGKFKVEWIEAQTAESLVKDPLHNYVFSKLIQEKVWTGEGVLVNSDKFNSINSAEAREKIVKDLENKKLAKEVTNYRIRDWLISRQRYWGAPIPIIHCGKDGAVAVPKKDLPVILPDVKNYDPTGEGSVLTKVPEWVNTICPKCGGKAKRETDTMDGYACSSWYFLRYTDPNNNKKAWDPKKANYWLPIDYYCGGDHAVSHLLYGRFWMYFFADKGWIEKSRREPVGKLVYNGYILAHDGNKMSKSKGNIVNPDELIEQGYGADSLRLFEMFIAPYDQDTNWNTNGVPGTFRFLQRFWTLVQEYLDSKSNSSVKNDSVIKIAHKAIKQVSEDLERLSFNTAVATLMEAVNDLYKEKAKNQFGDKQSWKFALNTINQLLAPFAPHIAEELWEELGNKGSVHISTWPVHNEKYLVEDEMTIAVQVNGKLRSEIKISSSASQEDVIESAKKDKKVKTHTSSKKIIKEIYIKGRVVNLVVK